MATALNVSSDVELHVAQKIVVYTISTTNVFVKVENCLVRDEDLCGQNGVQLPSTVPCEMLNVTTDTPCSVYWH